MNTRPPSKVIAAPPRRRLRRILIAVFLGVLLAAVVLFFLTRVYNPFEDGINDRQLLVLAPDDADLLVFIPRVSPVFAMYVKMALAMGLVFEMPTAVYFLARIGVVTAGFLLRQFKYAVLVIFIVAAILTPGTDVVSQAMMAGPMIVLYVLSIGIAWAVGKKKPAEDAD